MSFIHSATLFIKKTKEAECVAQRQAFEGCYSLVVKVLDYRSEGCDSESQVHQVTTAGLLRKALNPTESQDQLTGEIRFGF